MKRTVIAAIVLLSFLVQTRYALPQADLCAAYPALGTPEEAILECSKQINSKVYVEHTERAYLHRALAYQALDKFDEAIADFTKAIEINPKNGNAYAGRSWVWGKKGDYDKANADWAKAKELGNQ